MLDAALRNIHSSSHLFKLAQDAFRLGLPGEGQRNPLLLNAALELGLQVRFFYNLFIFFRKLNGKLHHISLNELKYKV